MRPSAWPFANILASVYSSAMQWRAKMYRDKYFTQVKVGVPVISIGNLTVGGTGKTPFTIWLLNELLKHNKKIAVVSRTYKSECKTFAKVDLQGDASPARFFGDEPVLLAGKFHQVDFFVGPSKSKSVQLLLQTSQPDIILVDDGFQHLALARNLDIVLLDATQELQDYQVLPLGRARESLSSLQRADLLVITKANLASKQQLEQLFSLIPKEKPVFQMESEIAQLVGLQFVKANSSEVITQPVQTIKGRKVYLLSALGRPEQFCKLIESYGAEVLGQSVFADHYTYSDADLEEVEAKFKRSGAEILLTTAKDAVKLRELSPIVSPLWVAELNFKPHSKGLYEKISELVGF